MTWEPGRNQIQTALTTGELQQVTGAQAAGEGWLAGARTKITTAELTADADPESAYVTAYDAARFALVGVLAHQGLRATQKGGHLGVELRRRIYLGQCAPVEWGGQIG